MAADLSVSTQRTGGHRIPQMELTTAILQLLERKYRVKSVSARHMDAVIKAADAICDEFNREDRHAPKNGGLALWIASDHVGMSSLFMARTLAPIAGLGKCPPHRYADEGPRYPYDPDDLWRCVGLLEAVPELRPHVPEMAKTHPVWAAYVKHWDEMMTLCAEEVPSKEAPKLYALMQRLQKEYSQ